jgi:membrane-associated phospholipid phosphatase
MLFRAQFRTLANSSNRLVWLAFLLAACAGLALFVDVPVSRFCLADSLPGDLQRLLTWSEVFAHGLGVSLLAVTIVVLDPPRRWHVPRMIISSLGAGLVADVVKLCVARFRPRHFSSDNSWESFAGWVPSVWPVDGFARWDHRVQSFPSAHAAVAVGLAVALASVYPRGRYLFVIFALLAAGQRVQCGAHFLSDVLAGGAIGCLVAASLTGRGWLTPILDRLERVRGNGN